MGCFDSVWTKCPNCLRSIEFQTKLGECMLKKYDDNKVPLIVALGVEGKTEVCPNCNTEIKMEIVNRPRSFQMIPKVVSDKDDDDDDFDPNWGPQ